MRAVYILPRPNLDPSAPVGDMIRVRELIRGFKRINVSVDLLASGKHKSSRGAKELYRRGIRKWLPTRISGIMRDAFYVAYDEVFRHIAQDAARRLLPFDFVIERYTVFCRTGVSLAGKFNKPLVLDDIAPLWEEEVYYRRDLRQAARKNQEYVLQQASACIAVSGVIRDYLFSCGVPREKVHVVGNGADCDRFQPGIGGDRIRGTRKIEDKVVIGFVGSFAPWHGLDLLVSSAGELLQYEKNLHFLIVGDGPDRRQIEQRVRDGGLADQVTFTGAVPFEDVPPYLDAMDIAVIPNTTTYCSPIKLFEYMAMEKPVVAPGSAPIKEIVTNGLDGVLFALGDRNDFNHALLALVSDEGRRRKIGTAARRTVLDNYTWEQQAKRMSDIVLGQ